jgi:glucan phosphoethanolaminetransferase (alkaline phosphatase superfamily)
MPDALPSRWTTWPAAIAIVLAAGAAWALAALLLRSEAAFMAAPAAFAAVIATGWTRIRPRWLAALGAAALTLFAATYALYLWTAALVAGGVGLDFGDALLRTGPGLASAMLTARLSALDQATIGACALLAAAVAARRAGRPSA